MDSRIEYLERADCKMADRINWTVCDRIHSAFKKKSDATVFLLFPKTKLSDPALDSLLNHMANYLDRNEKWKEALHYMGLKKEHVEVSFNI